jgi:hypothetical protein
VRDIEIMHYSKNWGKANILTSHKITYLFDQKWRISIERFTRQLAQLGLNEISSVR